MTKHLAFCEKCRKESNLPKNKNIKENLECNICLKKNNPIFFFNTEYCETHFINFENLEQRVKIAELKKLMEKHISKPLSDSKKGKQTVTAYIKPEKAAKHIDLKLIIERKKIFPESIDLNAKINYKTGDFIINFTNPFIPKIKEPKKNKNFLKQISFTEVLSQTVYLKKVSKIKDESLLEKRLYHFDYKDKASQKEKDPNWKFPKAIRKIIYKEISERTGIIVGQTTRSEGIYYPAKWDGTDEFGYEEAILLNTKKFPFWIVYTDMNTQILVPKDKASFI